MLPDLPPHKAVDATLDALSLPITDQEIPQLPPEERRFGGIFGGGLDPLTAGFNAAAAFFNFLSTEQGQRICKDIIDFDHEFVAKCHNIFDKIHHKVTTG
jgi:hypothetical protein